MFEHQRRKRRVRKVVPGDGSALRPYRIWQVLSRTLFRIELVDGEGARSVYSVDVHFLADEISEESDGFGSSGGTGSSDVFGSADGLGSSDGPPPVALFRDGIQTHRADAPAAFPVPGGVIEVATSMYGLTRMHYVSEDGTERPLLPHPHSGEGLRARFGQRFPGVSKAVGVAAVLVLLVGLVVAVPQVAEFVTSIDLVADRVGTFTSPIRLPAWANTALLVAGVVAATERALTLRHHWLIDADTTWTSLG